MAHSLIELTKMGQSIWLDYISRALIERGELKSHIQEDCVQGVTSNPSIFEKAIGKTHDYDKALEFLRSKGVTSAILAYENLVIKDIQDACELLRTIYERTLGLDGFASLEVSPHLAFKTDETVQEAKRLFHLVDRPNVMIKVPGTPEGIKATRILISEGINVNVTLLFSLKAYQDAAMAYLLGLKDRLERGFPIDGVQSVASFFISRIDTKVDGQLEKLMVTMPNDKVKDLLGRAAIANAQMAYRAFLEIYQNDLARSISRKGGHPQRLLWASTSTKNPSYRDTLYVDSLIVQHTVNTLPLDTLRAYKDHGVANNSFLDTMDKAHEVFAHLSSLGIDFEKACHELLHEGIKLFTDAFDQLMKAVEQKSSQIG